MRDNELVTTVKTELANVGITPTIHHNGKHIKCSWKNLLGITRTAVVAKTTSDYRAKLNIRAEVRRLLKQDGFYERPNNPTVPIKPEVEVSLLERVFAVPPVEEPVKNRLSNLEKRCQDLEDFIVDILSREDQTAKIEPELLGFEAPNKKGQRKYKFGEMNEVILDVMEFKMPLGPKDIASAIDRSVPFVSAYLNKLAKDKRVKNISRGQWVKLPVGGKNGQAAH